MASIFRCSAGGVPICANSVWAAARMGRRLAIVAGVVQGVGEDEVGACLAQEVAGFGVAGQGLPGLVDGVFGAAVSQLDRG